MPQDLTTSHDPDEGRWTATVGGEEAGTLQYEIADGALVVLHTVVDPAHEGGGVGSALVRAALDQARADGRTVTPLCSFARTWMDAHPEYADLLSPEGRP